MSDGVLTESALTQVQRDDLLARWSEPQRRYHTVDHLKQVLSSLGELGRAGVTFEAVPVRLAVWFHDAIYEIPGPDNESRSAKLAETMLDGQPFAKEVARLVRVTASHHVLPGDANAAALCDADLSILGELPARYGLYRQQVRAEYQSVPDAHFRIGRADVLRRLLENDTLFHTDVGRELWETQARRNVMTEIQELEQTVSE